jgi:hypothetical protein
VRLAALPSVSDLFPPAGPVTVWVMGADAAGIEAAYPAIDAALARRPGQRLLLTVPASDLARLRRLLPHESVAAQPGHGALERWLRKLKPALVIRIGADVPHSVLSRTPVAVLGFDDGRAVSSESILAALPETAPPLPAPLTGKLAECLVRLSAGPAIGDLDALRNRLGGPSTILCLGNGPSSEDPALARLTFDSLFRVNWIWRARDLLTEPDLVFTADPDLPPEGCRPIIAFPMRSASLPILAKHVLRLRPPRGYLFLDRLAPFVAELAAAPIPTNGALMIAVAAALQPRRLVIAGVDLYQHPAGRYPGDAVALDGYSRLHSRDRDLDVIGRALGGFAGEAVILGDALKTALGRG